MKRNDEIKKSTIEKIRVYILSREDIDSKDTWIGSRNYSLRELLEQVEKQTPDGRRFSEIYERNQEKRNDA
ncbi:MAG TPA: hypothetical protein VMV95_01595 [Bacillota bacterium]|nr:hypothetical protein [Bacillota bacterium]